MNRRMEKCMERVAALPNKKWFEIKSQGALSIKKQ